MPKPRRKTAAKRQKPVLPEGDEGADLEQQQREKKLQVLVSSFEVEWQRRRSEFRCRMLQMLQGLEAAFNMELMRIPPNVRKMEWSEFLAAGGTIDAAMMVSAEKIAQSLPETFSRTLNSITEEEEKPPTTNKKRGRGKKKENMPAPPSTTRKISKRIQQMTTPLHAKSLQATGWETPLITPKFDPRLPCTPAMTREPKPGENLVSFAGSPVRVKDNDSICPVPIEDTTMKLTYSIYQKGVNAVSEEIDVDSEQMKELHSLQQKISSFIKLNRKK